MGTLLLEDLDMRAIFDFTPYRRSTVGFDLLETGMRGDGPANGYLTARYQRDSRGRQCLNAMVEMAKRTALKMQWLAAIWNARIWCRAERDLWLKAKPDNNMQQRSA
jgi:hypothetical protein